MNLLMFVGGLVLLVIGADVLVRGASKLAMSFGISPLVVGLTIVAFGTSAPEVAVSVGAILDGKTDIAIGNVVGSNTFNILGCLGVSGILSGTGLAVAESVIHFDAWVMLAVALACLPIFITGREIARWEGVVFLLYYAAYTAYLILASQAHDVLPQFSAVMLYFVVPLTVITMSVSLLRHRRAGRLRHEPGRPGGPCALRVAAPALRAAFPRRGRHQRAELLDRPAPEHADQHSLHRPHEGRRSVGQRRPRHAGLDAWRGLGPRAGRADQRPSAGAGLRLHWVPRGSGAFQGGCCLIHGDDDLNRLEK